jgi:superfamily II DNA or RNA helicase
MSATFVTGEIAKGTDWRALERAVARMMSHCGWRSVQIVGRCGDGGGDVVGVQSIKGRDVVFVVQVKATTGGNYVGPRAIQEAVDALPIYSGTVAVAATNGDFSRSALVRQKELVEKGFDIRLWNGKFIEQLLSRAPDRHAGHRQLRDYQQTTVDRCTVRFSQGGKRVMFIIATGLGKTVIAAELLARLFRDGLQSALVLCHSRDLAMQLEQAFWSQLSKDIPTRVFFDGEPPKSFGGINFGLYQSFTNYLSGVSPGDYELVIVDEAHHAFASGFLRCLNHLQPRLLVGMTATPWRRDGLSIEDIFGPPVSTVSIADGMLMGHLAKVDYRIYSDSIDWTSLPKLTEGRLSIKDLNRRLFVPQRDEAVIDEINKISGLVVNPKVIVFCPSIEHGRRFAELMNLSSQLKCRPLSGVEKNERYRNLMEFSSGHVRAVTAVDVLNEGIDVPDVNIIVFLRCTHSRRIFVQQLGRGLRISPDTGKNGVMVLDFVADIRRLAEVMRFDDEVRSPRSEFHNLVLKEGVVHFTNESARPFVEQWLKDVADVGETGDSELIQFPMFE